MSVGSIGPHALLITKRTKAPSFLLMACIFMDVDVVVKDQGISQMEKSYLYLKKQLYHNSYHVIIFMTTLVCIQISHPLSLLENFTIEPLSIIKASTSFIK